MKRTELEINEALDILNNLNAESRYQPEIDAVIEVIQNDLDDEDIENSYYDANETDVESRALDGLYWLNGEIELDDILKYWD